MRMAGVALLLVIVCLLIFSSTLTVFAETQWKQSNVDDYGFATIELLPPPNALVVYLYGTPLIDMVPLEKLHRGVFALNPDEDYILNFYAFYYAIGTHAHIIGRDPTGQFLWVVVDETGQSGWIPIIQTDIAEWSIESLLIIHQDNTPTYHKFTIFED